MEAVRRRVVKTQGEEIAGWQLSGLLALLHVLNNTEQVSYANPYSKAEPSSAS
jgi:hypothetical protein